MDRIVAVTNETATPLATGPGGDPVPLAEINALMRYASERGKEPAATRKLYELTQELQHAGQTSEKREREIRAEILECYSELSKVTFPVTGRTLIDTHERFRRDVRPLKYWTLAILVLAVGNEIMKAWLADMPEPEEGLLLHVLDFRRYILEYCAPFMWGALGSFAYLLKRLSDYAEDQTYDSVTSHGWAVRVFLGAMLGGLMQFLFDPQLFSDGSILKPTNIAIGFLTGVGVKVVYGAIEKTIEVLADKLNLNSTRLSNTQKTAGGKRTTEADKDSKTSGAAIQGGKREEMSA